MTIKRLQDVAHYINLFGALYLVATMLLNYSFIQIHLVGYYIFFFSYFIEIFLDKKWKNLRWNKTSLYYIGMLLFFLLPLLYRPFDTGTYFKFLLEKRYPLLGIAIIGLLGVNNKYKLNYFLNTFIITSIAVIFYLILFKIGFFRFLISPERDTLFRVARIEHINSHMMFNFYLNISLISIWYMISRSWKQTKQINRVLYIGAMTIIFFILYLSEGRSGFLAGIMLMCAFIFFEIWKRKKTLGLMLALMIPFVFVFLASGHERISKDNLEDEPRLFLWEAAVEVIEESPIVWGNGISRAQEKYDVRRDLHETEQFKAYWHDFYHARLIDCHNQYLQTTMEFGIIGLAFLLFLYVYPFFAAENRRKLFAFFILCLSAYQSVFDMFITGQFCFLFCFLTLLILRVENNVDRQTTAPQTSTPR